MIISHNNPKLAPLNQDDFKMTIVEDLGLQFATKKSKEKRRYVVLECSECNNTLRTSASSGKNQTTSICMNCFRTTHGKSNTRIHRVLVYMKQRCYNKKNTNFEYYGGRGVSICDEWINNPEIFEAWSLANGYKEHLTIDRENNDGNYTPDNCRWVTKSIQARNQRKLRKNNTSGYKCVHWCEKDKAWVASITIDNRLIFIKQSKDIIECALAYDKYVTDNNLEHTKNFT